jgi:alkaline phosphatase D
MKRRDFLANIGFFVVGAKLLPACGDDGTTPNPDANATSNFAFPQGVASGDPRATSVVLWTRAVDLRDPNADVSVKLEVATDEAFSSRVAELDLPATIASDHTVRVLVKDLTANTTYHYRFTAGSGDVSTVTIGRTRTAPDANADVQVNLAWVSCQDYQPGHFGAYAQMIADDDARPDADRIHFVLHLGDAIYETINDPFQRGINDNFEFVTVKNVDGSDRKINDLPSGGGSTPSGSRYARTVDDYRHLYKTYFSDPNFMAARARWPFIHTWDDHEFTNDAWQSMANYLDGATGDEPAQKRKYAANRAWFEYIPSQLTGATGPTGVTQNAKDFTAATAAIEDARFTAANTDNFVAEPNNAAAVGSMTIYRSLRWGKHVELVITDQRSYRSDHAIPEDFVATLNLLSVQGGNPPIFFDPRNFLPLPLVAVMDAGEALAMPRILLDPPNDSPSIANPRATAPIGTMLGKEQKAWWKSTMSASDATWKLWGNEVPMMRMRITNPGAAPGPLGFERVLDGDAWDGWPLERRELLGHLLTNQIKNVVCLTGDIHAHFAGILMHNYDAAVDQRLPVAVELITAGVSSNSLFSFYESATRTLGAALRGLVTVDATAAGGSKFTENMNLLLLKGTAAAGAYAASKSLTTAESFADPTTNPHLKYVDTNAQGYGYAKVTGTQLDAELVTINRPVGQGSLSAPGIKRKATFSVPKDNPAGMTGPVLTGAKPFPLT